MVSLIDKAEVVLLSVKWQNHGDLLKKVPGTEDAVACAKGFLAIVENAVRSREGEIRHALPDRVVASFPISGRITDSETRAIECSRRMLMEFRRHNAKQPPLAYDVTSAVTSGTLIAAPGIAEVNLTSLVLGEPIAAADRMINAGKPDTVLVSETTYARTSFAYKGRPLDGHTPKIFELIL
jgi:class 3 adenylate cyclase